MPKYIPVWEYVKAPLNLFSNRMGWAVLFKSGAVSVRRSDIGRTTAE
jgi:hypothetical protein